MIFPGQFSDYYTALKCFQHLLCPEYFYIVRKISHSINLFLSYTEDPNIIKKLPESL